MSVEAFAGVLSLHREVRMMSTPPLAVECVCGWEADGDSYSERVAAFRTHQAEHIQAAAVVLFGSDAR